MKKIRVLIYCAVPLMIAVGVFAVRWCQHSGVWANVTRSDPVLVCPEKVELGSRELGEVAVSRLVVGNRGSEELRIHDIRTDCACSGLEREVGGEFVRVDSLRLRPDEETELIVRVSARGQVGQPARNVITFLTNDPRRPKVSLVVHFSKITAGVNSVPTSVVFGTLPTGNSVRKVLIIYDDAVQPRKIARVVSTNPKQIDVSLLPTVMTKSQLGRKDEDPGTAIGRVEVVLHRRRPGPINAQIEIHLTPGTRRPTSIAVSGRVVPPVQVMPPSLLLPRSSKNGPIYHAKCICRSAEGKTLNLSVTRVPPGLSVEIRSLAGTSTTKIVEIRCDPAKKVDLDQQAPARVRLRGQVDDQTYALEIPVYIRARSSR